MEKSRAQQRRDKKKNKKGSGGPPLQNVPSSKPNKMPRTDASDLNKKASKVPRTSEPKSTKLDQKKNKKSDSASSSSSSSSSSSLPTSSKFSPLASMRVVNTTSSELKGSVPYANYDEILADETLNSTERAKALLAWIVAPMPVEEFMTNYFENQPVLIKRQQNQGWYDGLLSKKSIEKTLTIQRLIQGEEVTLTRYHPVKKVRENLHQHGLPLLLSKFKSALQDDGASVRLLAPQKHHDKLWAVMSGLEENFGAMVGANAYLTPAGEQGFAPHFDDIEAFIMQLEGAKRWRVYSYPKRKEDLDDVEDGDDSDEETNTAGNGNGGKHVSVFSKKQPEEIAEEESESETEEDAKKKAEREYTGEACPLPRYSSEDFKPAQLPELLIDTVLEPGDLLFIPRGFIHQGEALPDSYHNNQEEGKEQVNQQGGDSAAGHSLHVTLSTAQNNTWADFMELLIPQAVASVVSSNLAVRQSLPPDYLDYTGVVNSDIMEEDMNDDEEDNDDDDDDDEGGESVQKKFLQSDSLSITQKRALFVETFKSHLYEVMEHAVDMIDASADQMGKRYLSDRLPPVLTEEEELHSTEGTMLYNDEKRLKEVLMYGATGPVGGGGGGNSKNSKKSNSNSSSSLESSSALRGGAGGMKVRMIRKNLARLCIEEGVAVVYHCMDNARWYHGAEMRPLEFPIDDAPAIDMLINAYPEPIAVKDLPHPASTEDLETKAEIASVLFKEGFLMLVD